MEYFFIIVIFVAQIIVTYTISVNLHRWTVGVKGVDERIKIHKKMLQLSSIQIKKRIKTYSRTIKKMKSKISLLSFDTIISVLNLVGAVLMLKHALEKKAC